MMETAIRHALRVCPYVARMAASGTGGAGLWGGGAAVLQDAGRCPVMGRAIATYAATATAAATTTTDTDTQASTAGPEAPQAAVAVPSPAAPAPVTAPVRAAPWPTVGVARLTRARVPQAFPYEAFFEEQVERKKRDKSYRYFNSINRLAASYPRAHTGAGRDVTVWCSNDYLGMSGHPHVVDAIKAAVDRYGAGAGGTRNIAGNSSLHEALEGECAGVLGSGAHVHALTRDATDELASLHGKERALVFTSCFVANDAVLSTVCARLPGCVIFSDASNHASMIQVRTAVGTTPGDKG
jgi:5-aminolevulinate synthase